MTELWTLRHVCQHFQVHKATVYRWIKAGLFPPAKIKINGTQRWDSEQINLFVAMRRNASHPK